MSQAAQVQTIPVQTIPVQTSVSAPVHERMAGAAPDIPVTQSLLAMVAVLVAVFVCAAIMRRLQGYKAAVGQAMRVKGGLSVGARERVVWIEAGGINLLIGVSPGHVQMLHVLPDSVASGPAPVADPSQLESSNGPSPSAYAERKIGSDAGSPSAFEQILRRVIGIKEIP